MFCILINGQGQYLSACECRPVITNCENTALAYYPAVFPSTRAALAYAKKWNISGFTPALWNLKTCNFTQEIA